MKQKALGDIILTVYFTTGSGEPRSKVFEIEPGIHTFRASWTSRKVRGVKVERRTTRHTEEPRPVCTKQPNNESER